MIRVTMTDGEVYEYNSINEAENDTLDLIKGCDFAVTVEKIEKLNNYNEVTEELGCQWFLHFIALGIL